MLTRVCIPGYHFIADFSRHGKTGREPATAAFRSPFRISNFKFKKEVFPCALNSCIPPISW